jgi:hypothetical protein
VKNIENQVGVDEHSGEQANSDQTDTQLAQNELADDEAAISNDLHELAQACSAYLDELKAAGASQDALAAAATECERQLAAEEQQANQDLQDCGQQVNAQVAGDPEVEQQLAADEQQTENDLQQSESQDEQGHRGWKLGLVGLRLVPLAQQMRARITAESPQGSAGPSLLGPPAQASGSGWRIRVTGGFEGVAHRPGRSPDPRVEPASLPLTTASVSADTSS